jgi:hypothetical protein
MNRIILPACLVLLLVPATLLWCQDHFFASDIFRFHTGKFDRSGVAFFVGAGAMQNNNYRPSLDDYLTANYDTDSTSHEVPRFWEYVQLGMEIPVQRNLKVNAMVDFYSSKYKMNSTHTGSDSVNGYFSYPQTEYAEDSIFVPAIGLKYWLVNVPGFAVTTMGDIGIPFARPSRDGFRYIPHQLFEYELNGPKLGFTVALDAGSRKFSVALEGGYVYLPMRFNNFYLDRAENFGGFKAALVLRSHF